MELAITSNEAIWFLIPSIPICLYVIYTDLSKMIIPNIMVLALLGVFIIIGPFVLPFETYLWRFAHFGVVLAVGYIFYLIAGIGAGDVKFAAAMATFIALPDWGFALILYTVFSLLGLLLHQIARRIGFIQRITSGWKSFDLKQGHYPLGISLAVMHLVYLSLGAFG